MSAPSPPVGPIQLRKENNGFSFAPQILLECFFFLLVDSNLDFTGKGIQGRI